MSHGFDFGITFALEESPLAHYTGTRRNTMKTAAIKLTKMNGPAARVTDEALVSDVRGSMTPSQMVERRLLSMLKATPLSMSRLQAVAGPNSR